MSTTSTLPKRWRWTIAYTAAVVTVVLILIILGGI